MRKNSYKDQSNSANASKDRLGVKTVAALISFFLTAVLSFFPLPTLARGIIGLSFSAAVYGICFAEINDGITSVFRAEPSNDSLNAIALAASSINCIYFIIARPETARDICPAVFASVFFSMLMKYLFVNQIVTNLAFIKKNKTFALHTVSQSRPGGENEKSCRIKPVTDFPEIFEATCDNDPSEDRNGFFPHIIAGISLIVSVAVGIAKGFSFFLPALAALLAVSATFTAEMSFVLPYITAQNNLRKMGSILIGYRSVEEMKDVKALTVMDSELFPPDRARVDSFRFCDMKYIDEAVEYMYSLLELSGSPIAEPFSAYIGCEPENIYAPEEWKFVENYGIHARINGDGVVLGNRAMLLSYDITPLKMEEEAAKVSNGKNIIYLGINGSLAAYMSVTYTSDPAMKKAAEGAGEDFGLTVETNDCNITQSMIQKRYDLRNLNITVREPKKDDGSDGEGGEPSVPAMISTKNSIGILSSVKVARYLASIVDASLRTKQIGIFVGLFLTAAALFIAPASVSSLWLVLFNLLWTLPICFLSIYK